MISAQLPLGRGGGWRVSSISHVYIMKLQQKLWTPNAWVSLLAGKCTDVLGMWHVLIPQGRGHEKSLFGTLPDFAYVSLHLAGSDLHPL